MKEYDRIDVSVHTDLRVCGNRTLGARGTLIHTTSGTDSLAWLQGDSANANQPASANALIARDGTQRLITPDHLYAYHAGKSVVYLPERYKDDDVSQLLIGIELECLDTQVPTFEQVDSLADLMLYYAHRWLWRWPLIYYGHYAVARPLGRRSDPVNLDVGSLAGRIYERAASVRLPGL